MEMHYLRGNINIEVIKIAQKRLTEQGKNDKI
jgi:hypothetical protein